MSHFSINSLLVFECFFDRILYLFKHQCTELSYFEKRNKKIEASFVENIIPCLDKSLRYQKRPKTPTWIDVQVGILGIHSFHSSDMEMNGDIYLYQSWTDHRCMFESVTGQHNLTIYERPNGLTHKGLQNLWQPDTHLLNAKHVENPETVTHIWKRGKVCKVFRIQKSIY